MPYLDNYTDVWSAKEARHLLKRTSFGNTNAMIQEASTIGLQETIAKLFEVKPLPEPPLKYLFNSELIDPDANYGETWVNAAPIPVASTTQEKNKIINRRERSFFAWNFLQMQNSDISIQEKMTLFWHNHFVAVNTNPHREYYYQKVLRTNALGNFKTLTKEITLDTNMLLYLSGSQNTSASPNENYSRELLELFTIGKGAAVGNGDYTNYTENDVVEMAKVLTGWRVRGLASTSGNPLEPFFSAFRHTNGSKQLSHRFNNAIISENGKYEYADLIDVIFEQEECANFISRKLYRWFVNSEISEVIETNVIKPMAKIIRDNNYEIAPALKVLLSSEHFFETAFCMIKSPVDLLFSVTKSLLAEIPKSSVKEEYEFAYVLYLAAKEFEQELFRHPNVAGWKAYYQEPLFYKTWVNNFLLPKRLEFCKVAITGGRIKINNRNYNIAPLVPVLSIASKIQNAQDPNTLINELAGQLFNYQISESQITSLKDILIPGLPDFEWTIEYSSYLADTTNQSAKISVENKLKNLMAVMVQMSEFQIM